MERIFNGYKIKYDSLNQYLLPVRASQKIRSINIYINLDDFYHKMHKPYVDREFQTTGKYVSRQMVSNIMNLIGHYKNWAIKEHLLPTIYLIYTTSFTFKNAMIIPEYREYFRKINMSSNQDFFHLNNAITNAYSILQVITKYIPRVYAIDTNYLEPSIVPLYISMKYPADYNLFVSRDEYDLQYANYDKWGIISPKGDNSTFVIKGTLWDYIKFKHNIQLDFYFHPEVFIWAKTILGDKYRTIPKLTRTGWKTVIQYLKDVSAPEDDSLERLEIQLQHLSKYITSKKIDNTNFNDNLYCTSVKKQVDALLESDKIIIDQQLVDMEDNQSLNQMNQSIFKEFPINLQFLLRQFAPNYASPNDDYFWRHRYK